METDEYKTPDGIWYLDLEMGMQKCAIVNRATGAASSAYTKKSGVNIMNYNRAQWQRGSDKRLVPFVRLRGYANAWRGR